MWRVYEPTPESLDSWDDVPFVTLFLPCLEWWTHNQWCVKLALMTAFCDWTTAVRLLAEVFVVPTQHRMCEKRGQFSLVQENVLGCRLLSVLRLRLPPRPPMSWHWKMPKRIGGVCVGILGSPSVLILMNVFVHFRFVTFVVCFNHFIRGSNSGGGRDFPRSSRPAVGPGSRKNWWPISSPEVNLPRRGVDHPLPSSAEVKESVKLCLCSIFGLSRPVLRCIVPFPLNYLKPEIFGSNIYEFSSSCTLNLHCSDWLV